MVCLSDWRLRRLASSARYRSIRRTMASTFSRGSPSPPRVSLLHMSNVPSVKVGGVAADYTVGALSSLPVGRAAWKSAVFRGYEALFLAPGMGRYVDLVVFYLDEVEARCASGTDTVRDGPRGRDDQTPGALLDGVDGVLVVVPAEDQLRTGGGVLEDLPHTHHVGMPDLSYNAEVPQAAGDGTPCDAVGRVYAGDDCSGYLQRRTQVIRDVPEVLGVLELVGLLPEEPGETEVAGHGPEPADVVVAGNDGIRCNLPDGIQVGTGVRKLHVRATLRQVAGDGHSVWLGLCNIPFQGVEAFGDRGTPEVQIRNMRKGGHEQRFYPNATRLQTPPCLSSGDLST